MITGPAVLLFKGRGLVSTLIKWQTRGPYSHAAFLLPDGRVLESWEGAGGVRIRPPLTDWSGVDAFFIPGMTPQQWDIALAYAHAQVGKKYDWWAIIRFVSRHKMPANDSWFCSELVFDSLAEAKVFLMHRIAGWAASPSLLSFSPILAPLIEVTVTTDVSIDLPPPKEDHVESPLQTIPVPVSGMWLPTFDPVEP